jgi:uncharacterized protein YgbK (DUF1537 family)
MAEIKIIALDDDPTGSQTVHGCLLLTKWDIESLTTGLVDSSPIFFVLSNTRSMDTRKAERVTCEVCKNLKSALQNLHNAGQAVSPVIVSRSDSTLRGHYPVETDVIARELGPFDAHFMIPAFFDGGRITRDSTHFVVQNGEHIPAHKTEFARDSVFGYEHSYLPDYIEEKTNGRIAAADVERFVLSDIRSDNRGDIRSRLAKLEENTTCVVDAVEQNDLDLFAKQLLEATSEGKRFFLRSAASILTSLARLPSQPVAQEQMGEYVQNRRPGAFLIGSYVEKTTSQLAVLLQQSNVLGIEVDVDEIERSSGQLLDRVVQDIFRVHERGETPVVYTSRRERICDSPSERLEFGLRVSNMLMDIVCELPRSIGYLVSKGGITSNDVLSKGLSLRTSRVVGQILPGCSVVLCPDDHPGHPRMPVVIFPGNVGDESALAEVYKRLSR